MSGFTPWCALAGGAMIGLSALLPSGSGGFARVASALLAGVLLGAGRCAARGGAA